MNWRGILGICAGLAIVLAGGWFWVQSSALWALGVVAAGLVVAGFGVAQIVLKRRGPRSPEGKEAKTTKVTRVARGNAVSNAADSEANSVAQARMAMIANRATGRSALSDALAEAHENGDDVEHEETGQEPYFIENDAAVRSSGAVSEQPTPPEAKAVDLALEPEVEIRSELEAGRDAEPKSAKVDDDAVATTESPGQESASVPQWALAPEQVHEAVLGEEAEAAFEAGPSTYEPEWVAPVAVEPEDVGPVALDSLPGFPWTARLIGIWAREVRFASPDDLRGAVIQWQRWADAQVVSTPVIEEAAAEFNAMLEVWRAGGAQVPGLSSDGWTAGQLAVEAGEDAALAALLPKVLRAPRAAAS